MINKSQHVKGFIAEEICKFHLKRAGFNIINSGKEWFDKDLADKLITQKNDNNNFTLRIFNDIIAKLPDFMIWKDDEKKIDYKFVEVKYRAMLDSKYFEDTIIKDGSPCIKYRCKNKKDDPLQVYKYMENLESIMYLVDSKLNNIKDIEFYIYLVTRKDLNGKTNILFGKVFGNKKTGYTVYFYTPDIVAKKFSATWNNYLKVSQYLIGENKIDLIYDKEEFLVHENFEFIQEYIKTMILS